MKAHPSVVIAKCDSTANDIPNLVNLIIRYLLIYLLFFKGNLRLSNYQVFPS